MNQQIGEAISTARQNRKLTQEEFAARLGVTPQAVSKWERGSGLPDISLLPGICTILNIEANRLLGIDCQTIAENNDPAAEQEIRNHLIAEPLAITFGSGLIPCIAAGLKTDYVNKCRRELAGKTGMLLPLLRLRDDSALAPCQMQITSYDVILYQTVFDSASDDLYPKIIDLAVSECRAHYDTILNKQLTKAIIDNVKLLFPGVADGLVPERISYLEVTEYLREIVRRQGSIRDMIHILEDLERR